MKRVRRLRTAIIAASSLCALLVTASWAAHAAEVKLNGHTFTLPDGFEIESVAGPPLVDRPISADFDEQGRLYVSDSSGSNDKVDVQLKNLPHRILRLEDTNGDGRFDKRVVFADKMMFPEGVLWFDGSLYVAAPPVIWKLTDTNGDGVADKREPWFDAKTLTGCANDLHGPYLGPDGWIYWCKGAFAEQTHPRPNGPPLVTKAAHIFRRRPEGGFVEPVMTGGMDNPVEVVFTPGGERIFTTTFLQHPGGGLRDGLIHAIYGGVYGKVHGVIDGHPRTGDLLPPLAHLGPAAPCGLVRLESDQFGPQYRDNLFACLFNMHKITRHALTPAGATFDNKQEDFLQSDNLDFHPTDIVEDADGSLIVVDTGGWYKLCCPTSQLWKPDILGGIYRVRRTGGHHVADARGREINWAALTPEQSAALLADPRSAVRKQARKLLARRGQNVLASLSDVLSKSNNASQRVEAVWTLCMMNDPGARQAVHSALADQDETVRQAALHAVSVWRDSTAAKQLVEILRTGTAHNRRAAAEALGRLGNADAVDALLAATRDNSDRILEHSLIYALIELNQPQRTRALLADAVPRTRRATLIALDQMPAGKVSVDDVRPLFDSPEPILNETAWWLAEHHPEWAGALADHFRRLLAGTSTLADDAGQRLSDRLARFASDAQVQAVMAESLKNASLSADVHLAVLNAMAASGSKGVPGPWVAPLVGLLKGTDAKLTSKVLSVVQSLSAAPLDSSFFPRLKEIAADERVPDDVRLQALVILPAAERTIDDGTLRFLCLHLDVSHDVRVRGLAVDVLLATTLDGRQLAILTKALVSTGPMELDRLLEAFSKSQDEQVGLALLAALVRSPSATALAPEKLKGLLARYGKNVERQSAPLFARIQQENSEKYGKLEAILPLVAQGDVRRGLKVFRSTQAACINCHAQGYLGGHIGPDLSKIGKIRSERDLLESILFPSASFVRSFEPTIIVTTEGKVFSGVVTNETRDEITLQLDAQKVAKIAVKEVEERHPGTVSIMPAGLDKQLSAQQLADLVQFLKSSQ